MEGAEKSRTPQTETEKKEQGRKTGAKAAGLKSIFTIREGELLMTSYGKGSEASLEKRVSGGKIADLNEKPAFQAAVRPVGHFDIRGRNRTGTADDPEHRAEGAGRPDDLVHTRDALEKRYFNETFQDNIHIQMIHNILDIEKILVLHINNIIYEINNLLRTDKDEADDLIGYFFGYSSYDELTNPLKKGNEKAEANRKEVAELFGQLCRNKRLSYFGIEIIQPEGEGQTSVQVHQADKNKAQKRKNPTLKLTPQEFFCMLKVLGQMRQDMAHGTPSKAIFRQYIQAPQAEPKKAAAPSGSLAEQLAALQKHLNARQTVSAPKKTAAPQNTPDLSVERVLTMLYRDRVKDLNKNFAEKSAINLTLLFTAFGITDPDKKRELAKDYYEFVVCKTFKNLGFSIKLLREHMTSEIPEAGIIKSTKYDTVRGKLNPFLDFAIFRHYNTQEERKNELVAQLRASAGEEEKEKIYSGEAQKLWPEIRDLVMNHILPQMNGNLIGELKRKGGADPEISESMLEGITISTEAFFFSKLIYMMTIFLNGKEINDLLTTLIHQFESIASFQQVMKAEGMKWEVVGKFDIFNQSKETAKQLRLINNFARMRQEDPFTKEVMFREAVEVLGYSITEAEMDQAAKEIMDPKVSDKGSQNRGIRNFIINNVITSDRFLYLARYSNIRKVRTLAQNRGLVLFILADIPDEQILRYYTACVGNGKANGREMREALADRISELNFDALKDVKQSEKQAGPDKQKKIAIVRLYLTVLYQAVKQLVYINARYFLAFHCVERDRLLYDEEKWSQYRKDKNQYKPEFAYKVFAADFLQEHPHKGRAKYYMPQNFAHSDDWAIATFRNKVDHLDAIRNADKYINDLKQFQNWYEVYHYIMQRRILEQYKRDSVSESTIFPGTMKCDHIEPKTEEYFGKIEKYGSYCKDFVKALCVPFAYNLPRYKNLAVDGLFDKNKNGVSTDPAPENREE